MPFKTRSKKRSSKKRSRKVRFRRGRKPRTIYNKPTVNLGLGFPKKLVMTHKYFETVDIQNTAGSTANYQFRCNDLFDPNFTGTGHYPSFVTKMLTIYDHYTVIGAKCTLKFAHGVSGGVAANACMYINDDTTITPTITSLMEQSTARTIFLPANTFDPKKITLKWSAKKAFGRDILGNFSLRGDASAGPTENQCFTFVIWPQDLASTQTYNLQWSLEYIAVWTEPKDISSA